MKTNCVENDVKYIYKLLQFKQRMVIDNILEINKKKDLFRGEIIIIKRKKN